MRVLTPPSATRSGTLPRTTGIDFTQMGFLDLLQLDEPEYHCQRGGGHQRYSGYDGGDQRYNGPISIAGRIDIDERGSKPSGRIQDDWSGHPSVSATAMLKKERSAYENNRFTSQM
ncbi:hypothetical protein AFCA_011242 [Aspergillus flavus]|nr:hypothetical protein AFCA_011242 [Aspergillus flavus]